MRKRYLLGAVVSALALAFAAVAIASPQFKQTVKLKYTTNEAKKPTGTNATLSAKDPGATPPGNQPGATKVVITQKGAKANTTVGKLCKLPKSQAASCSSKTKVGSGSANANIVGTNPTTHQTTVTGPIKNEVKAYLHKGGLFLVVHSPSLGTTVILDASLSKKATLVTNVKRDVPALPGGNKLVLTTFKLNLKKRTTGHGKKLKSLLTTPKCPKSKRWTSVTKFNYDDGTSKKITTHQKCKK